MGDLGERLERLGLSQYLEILTAEGFDTWETVLDITESDLNSLNVKLGCRRKLQRAIAEAKGQSDVSYRSDDSTQENKARKTKPSVSGAAGTSTKRRYRRHPKRDEYAPERPPSAYVIFSNSVRETLKDQELCFTAIAKAVGERWKVLPADSREACECQANAAKVRYYAGLIEYKKTHQYVTYQTYLEEFKAEHAAPQKGKKSKVETDKDTSTSGTRSRSDEQVDQLPNIRVSSAQPDAFVNSHHRAEVSPPIGPLRLPSGPSYPPISTSLAAYSLFGPKSPQMEDRYPPIALPRSTTCHKENLLDLQTGAMARDARGHTDPSMSYTSTSYSHPLHRTSSTTPPAAPGLHYQAPVDLPSRMVFREPARLPPLTHEYTTFSFSGGDGGHKSAIFEPLPLVIDAQKSMLMLPQPVPSLGVKPSLPGTTSGSSLVSSLDSTAASQPLEKFFACSETWGNSQ